MIGVVRNVNGGQIITVNQGAVSPDDGNCWDTYENRFVTAEENKHASINHADFFENIICQTKESGLPDVPVIGETENIYDSAEIYTYLRKNCKDGILKLINEEPIKKRGLFKNAV